MVRSQLGAKWLLRSRTFFPVHVITDTVPGERHFHSNFLIVQAFLSDRCAVTFNRRLTQMDTDELAHYWRARC
ncbi:hypothetical protein Rcae01_00304 [Novipirellula caenicola]|uniref:Uncharacterized protein n=1 Tax=Novipirellula caenicola TaxID=1536901 RepID=A0ABP9VJV3_9BACT